MTTTLDVTGEQALPSGEGMVCQQLAEHGISSSCVEPSGTASALIHTLRDITQDLRSNVRRYLEEIKILLAWRSNEVARALPTPHAFACNIASSLGTAALHLLALVAVLLSFVALAVLVAFAVTVTFVPVALTIMVAGLLVILDPAYMHVHL